MRQSQPASSITNALGRLRNQTIQVPLALANLSAEQLRDKVPGKWSRQEILGHLIDSAINNLKRFTDASFANGPYLVQRYNQDQSVVVNQYQALPILHLLTLWKSLNEQILYVCEALSDELLAQSIILPAGQQTLGWLINDYVIHLEHHVKTLLPT